MAVPALPFSLSQVASEFGASPPYSLLSFVRGGAYVPDITPNNGVPTAAPMSMSQLAGAVNYQSQLITVTEGTSGSLDGGGNGTLLRGYSNGVMGSRSPTSVDGNTINGLYRGDLYSSFVYQSSAITITLSGTFSQDEFYALEFNGNTYLTSTATFTSSNTWTWSYSGEGVSNVDSTYLY